MKKIKDFFHDGNDILLAIIIIVIAAGIILWRLGVILDYPEKHANDMAQPQQETVQQDDAEQEENDDAEGADDASLNQGEENDESTDSEG